MLTRFLIVCALLLVGATFAVSWMTDLPGNEVPPRRRELTRDEEKVVENLGRLVEELAFRIGSRGLKRGGSLQRSASWIEQQLTPLGHEVQRQSYQVEKAAVDNLWVDLRGASNPKQILLLGAHYDSYRKSPGADANASGVAVLIELARLLRDEELPRTVRLAFFPNGESPHQGTEAMGSRRYAEAARARNEEILLALCLDSVGIFKSGAQTQSFPFPIASRYPDVGNFLGVYGGPRSKELVVRMVDRWTGVTDFPVQGVAIPSWFPGGIRSDHHSFLDQGYPAVLLTDTRRNRYSDAGTQFDLHVHLSYPEMARLVSSLRAFVVDLARSGI